jgi:glycosyl transferase family 25
MKSRHEIPVYVISLARAQERREAICQHLADIGVSYQLVDAVDGSTLSQSEIDKLVLEGKKIHSGAIGCYLSHLHVYEQMKLNSIDVALVLEDDARLNPLFVEILNKGLSLRSWDYCFLDCDDHNDQGPVFYDVDSEENIGLGFLAYRLSSGPQTTHAYLITLEAAEKRLNHAYPIIKPIDLYDHLQYEISFYAIVSPKAAWVSEYSLESFTSVKTRQLEELSFILLRKWFLFYMVRDFIKLKWLRSILEIRRLKSNGRLLIDKRWKSLPSGREILLK